VNFNQPSKIYRIIHATLACPKANTARQLRVRNVIYYCFVAILMLMTSSCDFGNRNIQLNDKYALGAIDTKSNMSLYYNHNSKWVGVVDKQVVAYIVEDSFIAVIRRHSSNGKGEAEDYYFIPLTMPFITQNGWSNVSGPMSLEKVTKLAVRRGASAPLKFKTL